MGIILMVDGGFASQLGKYFIGQFLEKKMNAEVKYDLSWFDAGGISIDGKDTRNFDLLKVFPNIKFPIATKEEVLEYKQKYHYCNKFAFIYNEDLLNLSTPFYLDGYFGHWKYLVEVDFAGLDFNLNLDEQNIQALKYINNASASVAVHIRRGDFVGSAHDVLTSSYFINTINHMQKILGKNNPTFFIFSTDMDWVNENVIAKLPENINYQLLSHNNNENGIYDFYLMKNCQHQICSNSGFSFYSAFMNTNLDKKIIIPDQLIKPSLECFNQDIAFRCPGWIVMTNDGEIVTGSDEIKTTNSKYSIKASVIMPVYNINEGQLRESIESVLNQTFKDFEFIIINDFSANNVEDVISSYKDPRIKYIKNEQNMGVAKSLNVGFKAAKGEYIFRMDPGDISLPCRFERQLSYMDSHLDVDICGSAAYWFNAQGCYSLLEKPIEDSDIKTLLLVSEALIPSTTVLRNSTIDKHDLKYSPEQNLAEDYDLWTKAADFAKFYNIPLALLCCRRDLYKALDSRTSQEAFLQIVQENLKEKFDINIADNLIDAFWFSGTELNENNEYLLEDLIQISNLFKVLLEVVKLDSKYNKDNKDFQNMLVARLNHIMQCNAKNLL